MALNFSTYPVLNERLRSSFSYLSLDENEEFYTFFYRHKDDLFSLQAEVTSSGPIHYMLSDEKGMWTPEIYNLILKRVYTLQNYKNLFGPYGLACEDGTIGLAILWSSPSSRQRGSIPIGEFKKGEDSLTLGLEYEFPVHQLRGMVELTTVLYLQDPGHPGEEEKHLANQPGCLLGKLDNYQIQLDGIGSMFPIMVIDDPKEPLWFIDYSGEDPAIDGLDESFTLFLNKAHPSYKLINKEKKTYSPEMMVEIMTQALLILMTTLQLDEDSWSAILNPENSIPGSVAQAVRYFIDVFGFDPSSPAALSESIHKYLEQRML